jgi:hypothetical protein
MPVQKRRTWKARDASTVALEPDPTTTDCLMRSCLDSALPFFQLPHPRCRDRHRRWTALRVVYNVQYRARRSHIVRLKHHFHCATRAWTKSSATVSIQLQIFFCQCARRNSDKSGRSAPPCSVVCQRHGLRPMRPSFTLLKSTFLGETTSATSPLPPPVAVNAEASHCVRAHLMAAR